MCLVCIMCNCKRVTYWLAGHSSTAQCVLPTADTASVTHSLALTLCRLLLLLLLLL